MILCKIVLRPLGVLKQVFLACFEPILARFDPPKIPKILENEVSWEQKRVKIGSKNVFSKNDPRPFRVPNEVK